METETETKEILIDDWEQQLIDLANSPGQNIRIAKRRANRNDVAVAFMDAFEMIGGSGRLAVWANSYPTEFFRLYSKLIPKEATIEMDNTLKLVVAPSLQPSSLDQSPNQNPTLVIDHDPGDSS